MSRQNNQAQGVDLIKMLQKCHYARRILVIGAVDVLAPPVNAFNQTVEVTKVENLTPDLDKLKKSAFDVVIHADIINVHKSLSGPLSELAQLDFDCCVVRVNEGNKKGRGRKVDGVYQRNQKTATYVREIIQNFHKFDVTLRRNDNCIVIVKGRKYYEMDDDGEA